MSILSFFAGLCLLATIGVIAYVVWVGFSLSRERVDEE